MFDKILIKSESSSINRFLSIRDIVDMMFFYGEVHVVISQFELRQLLQVFGEDVLYELITSKRLFVHPCDQHIGAFMQGDLCSVGMFRHNYNSIEQLLYMYHREYKKDSTDNTRFASKFSKVLEEYRYPDIVQESIYGDIENDDFLSKVTRTFVKQYYPTYNNAEDIILHAEPVQSQLEGMYRLTGNIQIEELNKIHHQLGYGGTFSYSNVLLAMGETAQDCYLSSELKSDLITNHRWAETYKLRMNKCVDNAVKNKGNIDCFCDTFALEFNSPGEAFVSGKIKSKELLKLLDGRDCIKFKDWLKALPENTLLSNEFYEKIQNLNSGKLWVKVFRVLSQFGCGLCNPILGAITTAVDGFVGDKIFNGWNPKLFVDNVLRNNKLKQDDSTHYSN